MMICREGNGRDNSFVISVCCDTHDPVHPSDQARRRAAGEDARATTVISLLRAGAVL